MTSYASNWLTILSKARWKVTFISHASFNIREIVSVFNLFSQVNAPIKIPVTPASFIYLISANMKVKSYLSHWKVRLCGCTITWTGISTPPTKVLNLTLVRLQIRSRKVLANQLRSDSILYTSCNNHQNHFEFYLQH